MQYAGYFSLTCAENPLVIAAKARNDPSAIFTTVNPAASVITGAPEGGSIRFSVDNTISTDTDGCATTSFMVTPFGTNRIAAQWREGRCQGGQVILEKSGK